MKDWDWLSHYNKQIWLNCTFSDLNFIGSSFKLLKFVNIYFNTFFFFNLTELNTYPAFRKKNTKIQKSPNKTFKKYYSDIITFFKNIKFQIMLMNQLVIEAKAPIKSLSNKQSYK